MIKEGIEVLLEDNPKDNLFISLDGDQVKDLEEIKSSGKITQWQYSRLIYYASKIGSVRALDKFLKALEESKHDEESKRHLLGYELVWASCKIGLYKKTLDIKKSDEVKNTIENLNLIIEKIENAGIRLPAIRNEIFDKDNEKKLDEYFGMPKSLPKGKRLYSEIVGTIHLRNREHYISSERDLKAFHEFYENTYPKI